MKKNKNKRKDSKLKGTKGKYLKVKTFLISRKTIFDFTRFAFSVFVIFLLFFLIQREKSDADKKSVLGAASVSTYPYKLEVKEPILDKPDITSKSAIVASTKMKKFLYEKNPDLKLPPASTTKILTALLTINEYDLSEEVLVPKVCTEVVGAKMGLIPDEKINVESLLYGMLVASAGDAACTLSTHKFSSSGFIGKMNILAQKIGLTNTNFTNPIGLDVDESSHVSTARDLYLMTEEAIKNGVFRKIVGTKYITLTSSDGAISHDVVSTNSLLFEIPGSLGVKTGKTDRAKEVLVYAYQKHDDEIIIVVMGSDDRFEDTKRLLKYVSDNYANF